MVSAKLKYYKEIFPRRNVAPVFTQHARNEKFQKYFEYFDFNIAQDNFLSCLKRYGDKFVEAFQKFNKSVVQTKPEYYYTFDQLMYLSTFE